MKVKLSGLDQQTLFYSNPATVWLEENGLKEIGICQINHDETGSHFGILELDEEVDMDLYFYYRGRFTNNRIFIFEGLCFAKTETKDSPTTCLRDMIVQE